ncbi:Mfa1 family fimbria major subunit [Phocaeicola faecalis]
MRIKSLFLSMVIGLAFVGCSSEEDITPGNNGGELGEPQFLTVNLVTNPTNGTRGTRAAGNQHIGDPNNNSTYEEGLDAENKVTKVRFYFFNTDGSAAFVKKVGNDMVNYLEWTNFTEEGNKTPNVEKILTAQLIIESPAGAQAPSQIVAIINPMLEPASTNCDLKTLATVTHDAKVETTSGKFLMSNSTYAKDNVKQMAVSVKDKIKKTSDEALNDPVEIYVERAVAKVRLNSSLTPLDDKTNIFKTSTDEKKQEVTENDVTKEIYVKFLGWNTTAVSSRSRLVKEINPEWSATLFGVGATPWNWSDYCRCFWAINADNVSYEYGAFVPDTESKQIDGNKFQAQAKTKFDGKDWVYVNENASPYVPDTDITTSKGDDASTPTKVIISAQLVDKAGNALEFAEYGSTRTTIDGLKNLFANNCSLYKKETVDGATKFVKITPEELTVKTATAAGETSTADGKPDITKPGRYKSYVQLETDEDGKWYASDAEDATPITAVIANKLLKELGSAKVWKDGYTYYYFDINHFGNKIGVVRNHIYDATITKLAGLGTPVYDPEEVIYPEKPNDTFIAALIYILSWRVVSSNVELDW